MVNRSFLPPFHPSSLPPSLPPSIRVSYILWSDLGIQEMLVWKELEGVSTCQSLGVVEQSEGRLYLFADAQPEASHAWFLLPWKLLTSEAASSLATGLYRVYALVVQF